MKYKKIIKAEFISRPNRFVAWVKLPDGTETQVHVKNTGRCRELLLPGASVYLEDFRERMGTRKMAYSLIAVEKMQKDGSLLMVNMDSQAPNPTAEEGLKSGRILLPGMDSLTTVKRECTYGNSRFDFYLEDKNGKKAYLEVKGVTLETDGVASFPDAPTERGVKHVEELICAREEGFEAFLLFIIQMEGMKEMRPNDETHRAFGDALREAERRGVKILAYGCHVEEDSLQVKEQVPMNLNQ